MSPRAAVCVPYPADLFEAVHAGNDGDSDYYVRVATGATSLLELGSGAGRVLHRIATEHPECSCIGLELDPALLAVAQERFPDIDWKLGDMCDFALGRTFERIILPYNGIYCLLSEEDVVRMMKCVASHLTPDGLFVFDAYNADDFHADESVAGDWDAQDWVKSVKVNGTTWDVFESSHWDRSNQRIDAAYRHVPKVGTEVVATIPQRYLLTEQLPRLLEEAGLELLAMQGDFDQVAFDEDCPLYIVIARLRSDQA